MASEGVGDVSKLSREGGASFAPGARTGGVDESVRGELGDVFERVGVCACASSSPSRSLAKRFLDDGVFFFFFFADGPRRAKSLAASRAFAASASSSRLACNVFNTA